MSQVPHSKPQHTFSSTRCAIASAADAFCAGNNCGIDRDMLFRIVQAADGNDTEILELVSAGIALARRVP